MLRTTYSSNEKSFYHAVFRKSLAIYLGMLLAKNMFGQWPQKRLEVAAFAADWKQTAKQSCLRFGIELLNGIRYRKLDSIFGKLSKLRIA